MIKKTFLGVSILCLLVFSFGVQKAVANANNNDTGICVTTPKPGLYVFKLDTVKLKGRIRPYFATGLETNKEVFEKTKAKLVVNAGFFDPKNQQTISYVTYNSETVLDPTKNTNLMNNPILKPYMNKILNRSEFRIMSCGGDMKYDIAPHNAPVPTACYIKHAIQAGPSLLPEPKLEQEFFVVKKDGKIVSQSASVLHPYARTAIGIKDNNVYIIIATTKAPMTLEAMSEFLNTLELEKAMAFDGGGSTSIDYADIHIVSDKDQTARKLKSFLVVE